MKAAPALAPTAAAAPEGWSARSRPEVEVARGGAAGHDFGAAAPAAGTGPAPGAGIGGGQPLETGARRPEAPARRAAAAPERLGRAGQDRVRAALVDGAARPLDRLSRLPRPEVALAGRPLPAFRLCGWAGLAVAVALAIGLVAARGLSPAVMAAVVVVAVGAFLALALLSKVVTGRETLTYYHHQVVVLGAVALLLRASGRPLLPYLDVTVLGVGLFLACGRVGCLMVGCCHGRPASWGVRYRDEHAAAGFPAYLVGVRLLPVQALESVWALAVSLAGAGLVLAGAAPGVALEWYLVAYAAGRFFLELVRGDAGRVYLLGFSEAQWTSLASPLAVTLAGAAGALPWRPWCAAMAALLPGAAAAVAVRRRLAAVPSHRLLRPRHVREVAEALAAPAHGRPAVTTTSLGIRVSAGAGRYALSSATGDMDEAAARVLARLIAQLRPQDGARDLTVAEGRWGVFHVLDRMPGRQAEQPDRGTGATRGRADEGEPMSGGRP